MKIIRPGQNNGRLQLLFSVEDQQMLSEIADWWRYHFNSEVHVVNHDDVFYMMKFVQTNDILREFEAFLKNLSWNDPECIVLWYH